jgi:hypothetical protein
MVTKGGEVRPQGEPQELRTVCQLRSFEIRDREDNRYKVDYFRIPSNVLLSTEDPRVSAAMPSVIEAGRAAFPNYTESQIDSLIKGKVETAKAFGLIYAPQPDPSEQPQVVGFHIDNVQEITHKGLPAKVMYLNQVGMHPDYQDKGLMGKAVNGAVAIEAPDVLCTSSANPSMQGVARRAARDFGMAMYPDLETGQTPREVFELAAQLQEELVSFNATGETELILKKATLDDRLVRTYASKTSRGDGREDKLIHEILHLEETQHVFFVGLAERFNNQLLQRLKGFNSHGEFWSRYSQDPY